MEGLRTPDAWTMPVVSTARTSGVALSAHPYSGTERGNVSWGVGKRKKKKQRKDPGRAEAAIQQRDSKKCKKAGVVSNRHASFYQMKRERLGRKVVCTHTFGARAHP